ncbi:M23 family metallopeptidase [Thiorhodococcus mannitoliphagus]|uniref:M23 family metallopeptidase n=1 Tax=Thiorhodococcus mannitoliphagus TaxID=329406 RepID=A0A6P1DPP3_9GAMM|nr:M23 family metallopeptidase [Thiorhodococcus mannitoliphagus]NEX18881.1 M23 family metallopeptidase [Thiorhodococcus mannitoliphagus]
MFHTHKARRSRGHAVVIILAVLAFSLAGAGLGFWVGQQAVTPNVASITIDRSDLVKLVTQFDSASQTSSDMDAIVVRLGEMQAQLMRINALGERLVEMSGLNADEFDFENPPPQGGPEQGPVKDYTIKELASELTSVVSLIQDRERKLDLIQDFIMEKDLATKALPAGWPVRSGYVSSKYGFRIHPVKKVRLFHDGVDFASPRGSPIFAVADGVVTFSGRKGGYGKVVDIRHIDGLVTRYAHNSRNLVKVGQMVHQGQKIASVGSTGTATGPHVHFEVRRGDKAINPMPYLRSKPRQTLAASGADLDS